MVFLQLPQGSTFVFVLNFLKKSMVQRITRNSNQWLPRATLPGLMEVRKQKSRIFNFPVKYYLDAQRYHAPDQFLYGNSNQVIEFKPQLNSRLLYFPQNYWVYHAQVPAYCRRVHWANHEN